MRIFAVAALLLAGLAAPASADVLPSDILLVEDVGGVINAPDLLGTGYLSKAACAVYKSHPDAYDFLFVMTTIPQGAMAQTPLGWIVQNSTKGIGMQITNQAATYCSKRLRHAVKMCDIANLPDNPDDRFALNATQSLSGIQAMAHELGHHWMVGVSYDKDDGSGRHCKLRSFVGGTGSGGAAADNCDGYPESAFMLHWSAFFNSDSVMLGNQITDNGDGTFTLSNDGKHKFGPLDQYLMGLRPAEQVGPLFLVDTGAPSTDSTEFPVMNGTTKTIEGDRVDLTINDVIKAMGARVPASDPCHWKGVIALVYQTGKPPSAAAVAKAAAYGTRLETFYDFATDGRGSIDLTVDGRGLGTPGCPGTPTAGSPDAGPETATPEAIPDVAPADDAGPEYVIPDPPATIDVGGQDPTADVAVAADAVEPEATVALPCPDGGCGKAASSGGCAVAAVPAGDGTGFAMVLVLLGFAVGAGAGRGTSRRRPQGQMAP